MLGYQPFVLARIPRAPFAVGWWGTHFYSSLLLGGRHANPSTRCRLSARRVTMAIFQGVDTERSIEPGAHTSYMLPRMSKAGGVRCNTAAATREMRYGCERGGGAVL